MGIDLLDVTFRLEKEFDIRIPQDGLRSLFKAGALKEPQSHVWADIRVSDLVSFLERQIDEQNPKESHDVFHRVRRNIVDGLGVDESEVTPDAWLVRDLGME